MARYTKVKGMQIAEELYHFLEREALPGSEVSSEDFWQGVSSLIQDLTPRNRELLEKRDHIQQQLDDWHKQHDWKNNQEAYHDYLKEIGYWEPEGEPFTISTANADDEITVQAGPQLVVPVNNARYAINAANARWGSLYDALYGTDAISEEDGAERTAAYNPIRGQKVVDFGRSFLDEIAPLAAGSHADATKYAVEDDRLIVYQDEEKTSLQDQNAFIGFQGEKELPSAILLKHHGLHVEIQIDHEHPIGKTDAAGVKDLLIESALTTIMDCEDSVTAVDAEDKVLVYRNWLGLMNGSLSATFKKGDKVLERKLNGDRTYNANTGEEISLRGRSLLLVRNVGHLMTSNMVLDHDGQEVPEGMLDTVITGLLAKHELLGRSGLRNSEKGSVYIVKPKMHGSEEVAFANELFNRVEDILGLQRSTLKIGVMDEERRTSLNLANCIREVKERIVFINTGFLDRTGDEIHTSIEAGAVIRKDEMKASVWLQAYEKSNVDTGLKSGLPGRAQIGKGMWAMPDRMKDMLEQKVNHLKAGGNTAWVPSPTAATLHAIHYHQENVTEIQEQLRSSIQDRKQEILTLPLAEGRWSEQEIQQELDNNAQGILGYVVRWVEHGIGCSKVPDIHNVGLMEDRATLRISSQHLANWLHHGICTEEQVLSTMKRMAKVVDEQNAGDPNYHPMASDYESSIAFQAACELVFEGRKQPNGYTEPILHRRRQEFKEKALVEKR
ncbi:malate synthase G [Jeotgalibacillus soli]|uniref:Malate synthase G n=1 Tax=Jeotgalibacillus soli TaxID=889306 RepID=A0A0C2VY83_9BACL|nr:malate synthase G [Jeotgalibacillus soli]KIL49381.1 malate synthase [Jeotgalibacillus soli]